jgi:hypothetical protein
MSTVPDRSVELEVGRDPGVIVGVSKLPVALKQRIKAHQVGELSVPGRLAGGFLLEKDPHVVNLDDLLRVNLGDRETPVHPLKESFLLEARQRLPDGCPGDAEARGERYLSHRGAGLMHSGQDFAPQHLEDTFPIDTRACCVRHVAVLEA